MKTYKLRKYQETGSNRLVRDLIDNNFAVNTDAPGAGKTITTFAVINKLRKLCNKVIIASPYITITEQFVGKSGHKIKGSYNKSFIIGDITTDIDREDLLIDLQSVSAFIRAVTHSLLTSDGIIKFLKDTAPDLTEYLFVIDEAHRAGNPDYTIQEGTKLQVVISLLRTLGAKVLYLTATAYRADTLNPNRNVPIFSKDVVPHGTSLSELQQLGYAPIVNYETLAFDYNLKNTQNDSGFMINDATTITTREIKKVVKECIIKWREGGYQKVLFRIPGGNSNKVAKIVCKMLSEIELPEHIQEIRGRSTPTVLNVVDDNRVILPELELDQAEDGRRYDILVACRKFDEGTDCQSLSQIFLVGMPGSTRLITQLMGRVTRDKTEINGYAEWFGEFPLHTSTVVIVTPKPEDTTELSKATLGGALRAMWAMHDTAGYCMRSITYIKQRLSKKYSDIGPAPSESDMIMEGFLDEIKQIELNLVSNSDILTDILCKVVNHPGITVDRLAKLCITRDMSDLERNTIKFAILDMLPEDKRNKFLKRMTKYLEKGSTSSKHRYTQSLSIEFDEFLCELIDTEVTLENYEGIFKSMIKLTGIKTQEWVKTLDRIVPITLEGDPDTWYEAYLLPYEMKYMEMNVGCVTVPMPTKPNKQCMIETMAFMVFDYIKTHEPKLYLELEEAYHEKLITQAI